MTVAEGVLAPLATLLSAESRVEKLVHTLQTIVQQVCTGTARRGSVAGSSRACGARAQPCNAGTDCNQPTRRCRAVGGRTTALAAHAHGAPLFPALEELPYERRAPEPTLVQQRQNVLEALALHREVPCVPRFGPCCNP